MDDHGELIFTDDEYHKIIVAAIEGSQEHNDSPVAEDDLIKIVRKFELMRIGQILLNLTIEGSILPVWSEEDDDIVFISTPVVDRDLVNDAYNDHVGRKN